MDVIHSVAHSQLPDHATLAAPVPTPLDRPRLLVFVAKQLVDQAFSIRGKGNQRLTETEQQILECMKRIESGIRESMEDAVREYWNEVAGEQDKKIIVGNYNQSTEMAAHNEKMQEEVLASIGIVMTK